MSDEHHAADHFGEKCPECGTVHRVLDSLPDQPLAMSQVESLRESDSLEFVRGVMFMSGGLLGYDTDEDLTDDLVLSTEGSTKVLRHYEGTGWVVEMEADHEPEENPEEVGKEMWAEASQHASEAMSDVFGDGFDH